MHNPKAWSARLRVGTLRAGFARLLAMGREKLAGRGETASAPTLRTQLNWLVSLCLLPAFVGGAALLLLTESLNATAPGASPDSGAVPALWWWALACAVLLVAGLAFAEHLARRLTRSARHLAECAARLADGVPVAASKLSVREAEEVAAALSRVAALLHERTLQRDRAASAERRLRHEFMDLERRATHDGLTGLINRSYFDTLVRERLAECRRRAGRLTVLYIDVDGFKTVNDLRGHAVGDEILRLFAARLKAGVRQSERVARLGGDEFAVLIENASEAAALKTADGLIDRLSRPYRVGQVVIEVSASIGIAAYPGPAATAETLLQAADEAMYRAKRAGKCRYDSGFTPL